MTVMLFLLIAKLFIICNMFLLQHCCLPYNAVPQGTTQNAGSTLSAVPDQVFNFLYSIQKHPLVCFQAGKVSSLVVPFLR